MAAIPTTIAILALLIAAMYVARPYLPRRPEQPARVVGKQLRLSRVEGPNGSPTVLTGVVESLDELGYLLRLEPPVHLNGDVISAIHLTARLRGYRLSDVRRRWGVTVNGFVDGRLTFIAGARVMASNQRLERP